MIKYNLKCNKNHEFESWFADSNEFEKLNEKKLLECIYCSSKKITKSIMSPMVSGIKNNKIEYVPEINLKTGLNFGYKRTNTSASNNKKRRFSRVF